MPTDEVRLPGTRQTDLPVGRNRVRRVFVMQPSTPADAQGYPVLYVLDGNAHFPLMAQLARLREIRPDAARSDSAVVVGIGYPSNATLDFDARQFDYTPPAVPPGTDAANEGGADALLDDIAKHILPFVEKQFPIDPTRRTLFGHSYGGLFTLHTLFSRPALFTRYVAASPSIWWRQQAILATRDRFLAQPRGTTPLELLLTAGSLEQRPVSVDRSTIVRERRQIDSARELFASLQSAPNLTARFELLDGEDHGSAVVPAAARAIITARRRGTA